MRTLSVVMLLLASAADAKESHPVRAHVTKRGVFVPQHHATNPDATQWNNYSTKGNVNPYNGKPGTKTPKR